ncbi:MAG: sulfatase-like hydrolase/transferase [Planctomycetota bacterium]
MKRREFLKRCSLAAGSMAVLGSKALANGVKFADKTAKTKRGAKQYNLLFVLTDAWRYSALSHGAHHDKLVRTPNLDKAAKAGACWTRCYSGHPLCTPNRAVIITGRLPWEIGMNGNNLMLPPSERCIADEFTDAGYNSHYIGKWHMDGKAKPGFVPKGWRRRGFTSFVGFNRGHAYLDTQTYDNDGSLMSGLVNQYEPTLQTDWAIDFMTENKDRPFFCFVSWGAPHGPYSQHTGEFSYNASDVVTRPNVSSGNVAAAQGILADYYAHCTAMDHEFGRLMDFLDQQGLADNTLVVFTSDHGEGVKSHGIDHKNYPWEESWHVPLIMRLPGKIKPGMIVDNSISSADLMPTLVSLCGLKATTTCTGTDKSAALTDAGMPEESIYGGRKGNWRGVVKGDYKLVIGSKGKPTNLYNLKDDPYEQSNLVKKADYSTVKGDLLAEYAAWKTKTNDPFPVTPPNAENFYPDPV